MAATSTAAATVAAAAASQGAAQQLPVGLQARLLARATATGRLAAEWCMHADVRLECSMFIYLHCCLVRSQHLLCGACRQARTCGYHALGAPTVDHWRSSVLTSVLAAALAAVCGFCVPLLSWTFALVLQLLRRVLMAWLVAGWACIVHGYHCHPLL